jgi:transcriptional regulator with XRE-family HTH domain
MAEFWSTMSDQFVDPRGYQCYWKRIARHIGLSEAGKQLGIRASQLSAFERGKPHNLTEEQIQAYCAFLEAVDEPSSETPDAMAGQAVPAEP